MNPPRMCRAKLADKVTFNDVFVQYFFEFVEPAAVEIQAGQYVSMKVSDRGERRSYSICNAPAETHGFELLVDVSPKGLGTTFLESLAFGQEVQVLAPLGVFYITDATAETSLNFVATGSGVAPFRSMLFDRLQTHHDQRQMTLYWGLRHEDKLFWQDEFQELSESFPNFHFHPVISQPTAEWPLCQGRVTNCLSVHELDLNGGFYLCGNEPMVKDTMALLTAKGVPEDRIHHEKFY